MAGISPNFFPPPDSSGEMPAEEAKTKASHELNKQSDWERDQGRNISAAIEGSALFYWRKWKDERQGRREFGRGQGQIFLAASIAKFLRENIFPDDYVVIAFQRFYLNFSYQMSILCPKRQISCPLRGNISPKKMTGAQQKMTGGPAKIAPLSSPLGGPDERSVPTTKYI
jgi:hypothetical protein